MFEPELERLVAAALTDGTISEKEMAILDKRALKLGYDLDEFHLLLDSRIQEMNKDQASEVKVEEYLEEIKKSAASPYKDEYGNGISAFQELDRRLQEAINAGNKLTNLFSSKTARQADIVNNFPLPKEKDELLEFLVSMKSRKEGASDSWSNDLKNAYQAKYKECVEKAKALYPDDPTFAPYIEIKKKKWGLF